METNERISGCYVVCLYFITVIIWFVIGYATFELIDVKSWKQGIVWVLLWNGFTAIINTFIFYFGVKTIK